MTRQRGAARAQVWTTPVSAPLGSREMDGAVWVRDVLSVSVTHLLFLPRSLQHHSLEDTSMWSLQSSPLDSDFSLCLSGVMWTLRQSLASCEKVVWRWVFGVKAIERKHLVKIKLFPF